MNLRLAADFAPATYDDWRKLVDGVLKGAPFEKLVGKTYDGSRSIRSIARAQGAAPVAGRAAAAPWQIMQRIDHPDAAQANAQALHDLENGATGLNSNSPARPAPAALALPMHRRRRWRGSATASILDAGVMIALNPVLGVARTPANISPISSKPARIDPATCRYPFQLSSRSAPWRCGASQLPPGQSSKSPSAR